MIGYKAFDENLCCSGFQFEMGKTYTKNTKKEDLECCTDKVFHFCRELFAIEKESNYKLSESRICEVIAGDYIKSGDKYGTNSITILREITGDEKEELINSGNYNSGDCNSGDYNSGNHNSGSWNSGDCNSGSCNSGSHNNGSWNSGSCNSGSYNSGCYNSGNHNSGNWNSGNCNSGNWNSGNWNSGSWNNGYFNTNEPFVRIFNKESNKTRDEIIFPSFLCFDLNVWVSHDTATEEEKEQYKEEIKTCGGFLKVIPYKDAFQKSYAKADWEDKIKLFQLPNFDVRIFEEISGINTEEDYKKYLGVKNEN